MAARPYIIPRPAHHALTHTATFDGARVVITEQLDPAAWTAVKTTLEKAGAVYVVGASAFEFEPDQDAHAIVGAALTAGQVMSAAGSHGYVATPADLADHLVSRFGHIGSTRGGHVLRVLEPSAGVGSFVRAVMGGDADDAERCTAIAEWLHVTAVEIDPRRARQIPASPAVTVVQDRFEDWAAHTLATPDRFDRIVMNPPFAVPGDAGIWARHLLTAWELLAPGGRLVAIVPASVTDTTARSKLVREAGALVHRHGRAEPLDRDAFAESGVIFATAVVWLDRPLTDTPPALPDAGDRPAWTVRPYTGAETPIPVLRPFMSRAAAELMPVQACADWSGTVRTIRYAGECAGCGTPTWCNGYGDPRGDLGMSIVAPLNPEENGAPEGLLTVVQCFGCYDSEASRNRVSGIADRYWASQQTRAQLDTQPAVPAQATASVPYVSGWSHVTQLSLLDA
jgi:hypothetical protein